jgi:hypothetical protein
MRFGVGLGANLNAVGALGTHALKSNAGVLSAQERFRLCSLTAAEANPVPTPKQDCYSQWAFGALLGFTAGSRDLWFNLLCASSARSLWAGGFIIIGLFDSWSLTS